MGRLSESTWKKWSQDALEVLSVFVDGHYPGSSRQAAVTQFFHVYRRRAW